MYWFGECFAVHSDGFFMLLVWFCSFEIDPVCNSDLSRRSFWIKCLQENNDLDL